jgi:hypothetical protein
MYLEEYFLFLSLLLLILWLGLQLNSYGLHSLSAFGCYFAASLIGQSPCFNIGVYSVSNSEYEAVTHGETLKAEWGDVWYITLLMLLSIHKAMDSVKLIY